ncbi:MAG: hypothetical protein J6Q13_02390 [Clostridia bacterium]|nr:hypothetical protein [Clostridia bacterium]
MTKTKQIKTEEKYTITDIKEFLKNQLNWDWNEEVFDRKIEQRRKAVSSDFVESVMIAFKIGDKDLNYHAKIKVSDDMFKYVLAMKAADLSQQWQNFLAEKENNLNV